MGKKFQPECGLSTVSSHSSPLSSHSLFLDFLMKVLWLFLCATPSTLSFMTERYALDQRPITRSWLRSSLTKKKKRTRRPRPKKEEKPRLFETTWHEVLKLRKFKFEIFKLI